MLDTLLDLDAIRDADYRNGDSYVIGNDVIKRKVTFDGKDVLILATKTDDTGFNQAAWQYRQGSKRNPVRCLVAVQAMSSGHVNVLVNQQAVQSDLDKCEEAMKTALSQMGSDDEEAVLILAYRVRNLVPDTGRKKKILEALGKVVSALRREEADNRFDLIPQDLLTAPGSIAQAREWFYHPQLNAIFNSSLTAPDTPPTALSLEQVVEIVVAAFSSVE